MGRFPGRLIATFCYIGLLPGAPGTWASLTILTLWLAFPGIGLVTFLAILVLILVVGTLAADSFERDFGHDDHRIVIDEVAGMLIAVTGFRPVLGIAVAAFLLFRLFDILKPPPVYQLQALRGGLGVMADDVSAGILANLVLRLVLLLPGLAGILT